MRIYFSELRLADLRFLEDLVDRYSYEVYMDGDARAVIIQPKEGYQ